MNIVTQLFLPLALAFIMFSMGLSLIADDFKNVFKAPKAFALGTFVQMIIMPALGFLLASVWNLDPYLAVGVIILAACPGGVTTNLLTYIAKGDTALSISLTAVISILSVFSIPLFANYALGYFLGQTEVVEMSLVQSTVGIFLITTVPVAIGMWIKAKRDTFATNFEPKARKFASLLFVIVILGAIAKERANLVPYFLEAGPITLTLNIAMMLIAYAATRMVRLGKAQAIAISIECGIKNGTLGIFVAATLLQNTKMMIPSAIYSLLMFVTVGVFIGVLKYQNKKSANLHLKSSFGG